MHNDVGSRNCTLLDKHAMQLCFAAGALLEDPVQLVCRYLPVARGVGLAGSVCSWALLGVVACSATLAGAAGIYH